jgi:hypothetical protein
MAKCAGTIKNEGVGWSQYREMRATKWAGHRTARETVRGYDREDGD